MMKNLQKSNYMIQKKKEQKKCGSVDPLKCKNKYQKFLKSLLLLIKSILYEKLYTNNINYKNILYNSLYIN